MGLIDPELPEVGLPVTTEDPKVRDALAEIVAVINGNLDTLNLADDADVNGTQLLDASVGNAKLTTNSVDTANIVDNAVTASKFRADETVDANRPVTTDHIRNDAVTADKLRDDASTDANRAVTTNHIRNVAVTAAKIADDAVTSSKLDLTVSSATPSTSTVFSASTGGSNVTDMTVSLTAGTYLIVSQLSINQGSSTSGPAAAFFYNQTASAQVGTRAVVNNPTTGIRYGAISLTTIVTLGSTATIGVRLAPETNGVTTNITVSGSDTSLTAVRIG